MNETDRERRRRAALRLPLTGYALKFAIETGGEPTDANLESPQVMPKTGLPAPSISSLPARFPKAETEETR